MGIQQEECCIWGTKLFWISSSQKISLTAGEDISMMDEKEYHETIHEYHSHVSGLLSSKTKNLYEAGKTDTVRGSLISGNETHMESGRDMTITGSVVVSSKDTTLLAGRNFKAESTEERSGSTYRESVKKRGLLSGGGLGFTMGSEKRKDRYDSEAVEQVGSTIGSVEGNVRIGAGKDAAILGSEVTAGKDISISGENVNLQHTENTYSSLEKHEMAMSGLSVSLGGRTVETVHSIAAPLMRAGEVEDARLKGLYALQAGQTVSNEIKKDKQAGQLAEGLRKKTGDLEAQKEAKQIENSRLGKKNSFALDIALGSTKSKSEIESIAHVIRGSMIHGEETVSVRAEKDISVSGSRIEGKGVNLEAGRHILITAGENRMEEKQNTRSTSENMGVSLGVEGIQGIRGGYSSGKGKEEETSRTYEDSRIKAENTLTFVSGKDTAVKGGKLEGDRVKGVVGGSLSLETVQDEKSYHEESHSAGISLSYDFTHGKSGLSGGLSKENRQSHYESASSQSGIYAGNEGFDISVKDNTHLKGAVIDSKGDAGKNTLRTGTLSWEDVENKADFRLSGKGISVNKTSNAPYNEKGITPAIPTGSSGKADSTTRAGIVPGTIMIQDKDNQRQDTTALNRNTRDSLNKLGEIFNKTKVEERQELAGLFGKLAFNYLHDAKLTPNQRAAWHAAIGGIMGQLSNKNFMAGALPAGINEMMIGEIQKAAHGDPALMQWISAGIGSILASILQFNRLSTDKILLSGIKYNLQKEEIEAIKEALESNGIIKDDKTKKIITKLLQNTSTNANDIIIINASVSAVNKSLIFDMKTGKSYYSEGVNSSPSSGIGISINLGNIITSQADKDVNDATFRDQILSGLSVSVGGYIGIGGGISLSWGNGMSERAVVYYGVGTPSVGVSVDEAENTEDRQKKYIEDLKNGIVIED